MGQWTDGDGRTDGRAIEEETATGGDPDGTSTQLVRACAVCVCVYVLYLCGLWSLFCDWQLLSRQGLLCAAGSGGGSGAKAIYRRCHCRCCPSCAHAGREGQMEVDGGMRACVDELVR